jgi:hypothetical protein
MTRTAAEYDRQRAKPRVNITMDTRIRERAEAYAEATGQSLSMLIELSLGEYLVDREKKLAR